MNRLQQIEQRLEEIRQLLNGDSQVDMKALEKEIEDLKAEKSDIEKRQQYARELGAPQNMTSIGLIDGITQTPAKTEDEDVLAMDWEEAIATDEYRNVWAKDMMGKTLSSDEQEILNGVNDKYRNFIHDTENTQILIPKTVASGIWTRAEEESSLWTDVRKLYVTGNLSMIKGKPSDDAKWYDEETEVDTDQLQFGELNLTGCELAKAIAVTWKLKKMSISEFESYIISEIGQRMGTALAFGTYVGKGKPSTGQDFKPEPYGIKTVLLAEEGTPQIIAYGEELEYKDLTNMMSKIFSAYANGATIYANNTTIWNVLANLLDGVGRPLFIPDVTAGGVGRILGRTVKPDPAIPEGEILLGNLRKGYLANINEGVTMHRQTHMRKRIDEYMGYAIVDGDVLDSKAFVILKPELPAV